MTSLKYKISSGYMRDMWFVKEGEYIVFICFSAGKAQNWVEKQENEAGKYNDLQT